VQYFAAEPFQRHHGWVRANCGRVERAYAWAGQTVWHQGPSTLAERELGLRCFEYTEVDEQSNAVEPDLLTANVEKVPLLAARWSLDPAGLDGDFLERQGVAGESSRWR
jgi:hypothetical protein